MNCIRRSGLEGVFRCRKTIRDDIVKGMISLDLMNQIDQGIILLGILMIGIRLERG
jgi:hypothetical protein